ncbi:MAG: caspase family protein, partial [Calditrichaeota bacterium]|nr:caspase family protein [Calditrichota bacterium]
QNLPEAPYADKDAQLMETYFQKVLGVEQVVLAVNDEVSGFFFDDMFNTQNGALAQAVIPGQTDIFVYYSGHGIPNKDGSKTYLFPSDGRVERLDIQGYEIEKFYANLAKLNAKSVTVILDACFSGASRTTEKIDVQNLIAAKGIKLTVKKPWEAYDNFTVINSSTGEETSLGYDDAEFGLFTYYLAAGMKERADADKDRKITLAELKDYVIKNVTDMSKRIRGQQTPEFYGNMNQVLFEY